MALVAELPPKPRPRGTNKAVPLRISRLGLALKLQLNFFKNIKAAKAPGVLTNMLLLLLPASNKHTLC